MLNTFHNNFQCYKSTDDFFLLDSSSTYAPLEKCELSELGVLFSDPKIFSPDLPTSELHPFPLECPLLGGMRRQGRSKKKTTKRRNDKNQPTYRVITSPGGFSYAPSGIVVDLTFCDTTITRNNAGARYAYWRLRANSVYDPDPLLLTGPVSGFNEWASIYRRYLVKSVIIDSEMVNKEAFPVGFSFAPSDIDLSTVITSAASAQDLGETPLAVPSKMMSAAGGLDRLRFRKSVDLGHLSGQRGAYTNSLVYSSLVNSNPSILLFLNFALFSDTNLVNGVVQNTRVHFRVLLTERQTLLA
jgi:hypothetical protein